MGRGCNYPAKGHGSQSRLACSARTDGSKPSDNSSDDDSKYVSKKETAKHTCPTCRKEITIKKKQKWETYNDRSGVIILDFSSKEVWIFDDYVYGTKFSLPFDEFISKYKLIK